MAAPIQASTTDTGSITSPFTQNIGGIGSFGAGGSHPDLTLAIAIGGAAVALIVLVLVLTRR